MTDHALLRISPSDLDSLMSTLEVRFLALSECRVGAGHQLKLGGFDAPGLHYNLRGAGRMFIGDMPAIELRPHTLVIVPADSPFRIESGAGRLIGLSTERHSATVTEGNVRRFSVGGEPEIVLFCGFFHATYGSALDLFGTLSGPIVEQFGESDRLDMQLRLALDELVAQEVGSGAMSAALLKQVIVALLRRSLGSVNSWVERFSMLSDPQIVRAFASMVAHPGAAHTVETLADDACLSRSAFMARFARIVGRSPMTVLRDLRMRQAALQLKSNHFTVEQVARNAGYTSRSSFVRAFRAVVGTDPSDYRATAHPPARSHAVVSMHVAVEPEDVQALTPA